MTRKLLTVDLSYQTYRAAASHPMLTCGQVFTGGLYSSTGNLTQISLSAVSQAGTQAQRGGAIMVRFLA